MSALNEWVPFMTLIITSVGVLTLLLSLHALYKESCYSKHVYKNNRDASTTEPHVLI